MVRQRNIWFSQWCCWNFKSSEMLYHVDRRLEESQSLWKRRFLFTCRYGVTSQKTCNLMLWYLIAGLKPQSPCHFERQYSGPVSLTLRPTTSVTWLQVLRKQTNTGTPTALTAEHKNLRARFSHSPDLWCQPCANVTWTWSWRLCGINPAYTD